MTMHPTPALFAPSPGLARRDAAPTSRAAAESVQEVTGALRRKVLDTIRAHPHGLTCDDVERLTELRHQTASARIRELAQAGAIRDAGCTRPTRSGRPAVVWIVMKAEPCDRV